MKISKYCGTCKFNIQGEINKKAGVVNFKCELSIRYFNEDFNVSEKCNSWKLAERHKNYSEGRR